MADFLADFKRRESSEGSNIDDEEDEPHQFARGINLKSPGMF